MTITRLPVPLEGVEEMQKDSRNNPYRAGIYFEGDLFWIELDSEIAIP